MRDPEGLTVGFKSADLTFDLEDLIEVTGTTVARW